MATVADLSIDRIPRRKLAEEVATRLLDVIGGLEPGTRLPSEKELGEAFGVGRSTIREALKGLALLGVVESRQGQGAFVGSRDKSGNPPDAIVKALAMGVTHDLLEARRLIEVEVARLAAVRRTSSDLTELASTVERQESAVKQGRNPARPATEFHLALADAGHNEILASFVQSFGELINERLPSLYELDDSFRFWELAQHRSLYEAVLAGTPELAVERMQEHVEAMAEFYRRAGTA